MRKNPKSLMKRTVIKTSQRNFRIFNVISGINFFSKIVLPLSRSLTFIISEIEAAPANKRKAIREYFVIYISLYLLLCIFGLSEINEFWIKYISNTK